MSQLNFKQTEKNLQKTVNHPTPQTHMYYVQILKTSLKKK